jgi:hypothetical protein
LEITCRNPPGTRIPALIPVQKIEEKTMKVRISAVIAILALAAWLPIQAQQAPAPNAPATPATTAADGKNKDAAAHSCCHPKAKAGQEATSEKAGHAATDCCHGKGADAAKAACCAGKEAKDMAGCCGQKEADGKSAMNGCEAKKDTICAAKGGKTCCSDMSAKNEKGCCAGMTDRCAAHANGK